MTKLIVCDIIHSMIIKGETPSIETIRPLYNFLSQHKDGIHASVGDGVSAWKRCWRFDTGGIGDY